MSFPILPLVASGDPQAVEQCLDRYGGLVWSLARRYCLGQAEAEDAVQEVFVEIWKSAERFDASIASEPTFIAMIARRRIIDLARRRARQVTTTAAEEELEVADPAAGNDCAVIDNEDEMQRIRVTMQQLRPEERQVLELAISQGLSQSKIASTTGLPLGTVKSHARRGLMRLRELFGADATCGSTPSPSEEGMVR